MNSPHLRTSLVIATYNWPSALDLVLKSVLRQSVLPDEIVIADDGSTSETKELIAQYQQVFSIPIRHFWHEDKGYTKTIILNKAMKTIENDYIIQIDGDVILHSKFIEDHISWRKKDCWLQGSRVLLGEEISEEIQKTGQIDFSPFEKDITNRLNAIRSPFIRKVFFDKEAFNTETRGCNMSYWAGDFFKVNGFNEDIIGYSREDSELAARFTNNGIKKRKLKFGGLQYHIHHEFASRERSSQNISIEQQTIESGIKYCLNGLKKIEQPVN